MLFVLFGSHTGMGSAGRAFFRKNGVEIIKKYHYCNGTPQLSTFYESRNYVDELTFYKNTDPLYRYSIGNIEIGFNRSQIVEATAGDKDFLLTLSTERVEIIRDLKNTYKNKVQVIFAYTDDATLESTFRNLNISEEQFHLRCSIGKTVKEVYRQNPELFDYMIVYSGENTDFDCENMLNQYNTFYIKAIGQKDSGHTELFRCVQEIKTIVTETNQNVSEMSETLKKLVDFFQNDLQHWLQHEKQLFSNTVFDKNDESSIAASVARSNYYINEHISTADCLVKEETKNLEQLFGKDWGKLFTDTKTSLVSAAVLWKSCNQINDRNFDYSGICIAGTSALEAELKRIFYTGFQDYLKKKYGDPKEMEPEKVYKLWPDQLLDTTYYNYRKNINKIESVSIGNYFTMGTLPHLFYSSKNCKIRKEMTEYLNTIFKPEILTEKKSLATDIIDKMYSNGTRDKNSFVSRCEAARESYRNPAAHSGIISKETAEDCTCEIIGKIDAYLHVATIRGLIMELYSYLK